MTRNAQDIIDDMRSIVKPRIAKMLLEANFEGCGKEDKVEFETEFEMLLTLAEKALEQQLSSSENPNKCDDAISRQMVLDATVNKNSIWNNITNAKGENLEEIILQLPSVNQLNKWIGAEVIDEIRAEIEQDAFNDVNGLKYISVNRVNQIIDKHIAECEEDENDKDN